MSQEEKLEALKQFLVENNIEHWINVRVGKANDIVIPLYLRRYKIAVHVGDDNAWYRSVRSFTHPVFIRESDTVEFVIEKVQNVIIEHLQNEQLKIRKQEWKENNKKKVSKFPYHAPVDPAKKNRIYGSMTAAEKICVTPRSGDKKNILRRDAFIQVYMYTYN